MRRLFQLLALVSIIGGMALLAGCQKESWSRKGSAKEVKFGAKAHSSVDTRTEYMNYDQTKDYQNIKWLATDKIRIYSPDAARRNAVEAGPVSDDNPYYYWADYQIVPDGSDPTQGTLKNLSNDGSIVNPSNPGYDQGEVGNLYDVGNGLVWLNGNQATFYGVYPRKAVLGKNGTGAGVADGKFTFTIPASQTFSEKGDMDYAYMTATTSASQGNNVTLNFFPDFTAFEISVKSAAQGSDVKLNSFTIGTHSTKNYDILNGDFDVDLSGDQKSYTISTSYEASRKKITVANINQTIPAESAKDSLVFTVFALPDLLRDLYVEFNTTTDGVDKTWKLDLKREDENEELQPIRFAACKKHRIYGLALPGGWSVSVMLQMDDDNIEWIDGIYAGMMSEDYPQASQFTVTNAINKRDGGTDSNDTSVEGTGNKADRQTWWFKSDKTPIEIDFNVTSPVGGTWLVEPQGNTGSFDVTGSYTKYTTDSETGTVNRETVTFEAGQTITGTVNDGHPTKILLKITPKSSAASNDKIYFKTSVTNSSGSSYSLDSETQLYDMRGYHYFVIR